MTEKDQIHTLLADLAEEDSPVDIDLDRQIRRGRRRAHRHTAGLCVTAVTVPAVLLGGILALRPAVDGDSQAAGTPSNTVATTVQTSRPIAENTRSTAKSRALLAQLRQLTPELWQGPGKGKGYKPYDYEVSKSAMSPGVLHATLVWSVLKVSQFTVGVDVGHESKVNQQTCGTSSTPKCTEVRHLADGSIAYLRHSPIPNNGYDDQVSLKRPDGILINVHNAADLVQGMVMLDVPLNLERLLEIARQVTVMP
jgi:hypothetical protein